MTKELFAMMAAFLAVAGNIPYLCDLFRGRVKPHPYTWLIWSIVTGITFFGQLAKGAGVGAWPTGVSAFFTVSIFLLALRYGFRHIVRKDTYFLLAALLGLIPWMLTKDPTYSVVIVVTIDIIAFIPTLRKTALAPKTETPLLFATNVLRHLLTLLSLEAYNVATMLHSIAMVIANSLMTYFIVRAQPKKK